MIDSFGKHRLQKPPERVVVTDWTLLEQILELGITPAGAPELERYHRYVGQPALPDGIADIGLRRAPDLQTLKALAPDMIIVGTDQKSLARPFSHIAPVLYYNNFSAKYRGNGEKTRVRFLQLADLFQRRALAQTKLAAMDAEIEDIGEKLYRHFDGTPPVVTLVRLSSVTRGGMARMLVYGENSIPVHALEQLGLTSGAAIGRSKWGYKEQPLSRLKDNTDGIILYIEPLPINSGFLRSDRWLTLPPVQQNRVHAMGPAWSYGGAMSILYNARAIYNALLALPD